MAFAGCLSFLPSQLSAQDSFDNVINLPGDPVFGDSFPSRTALPPATQINLSAGGEIGGSVDLPSSSELNVSGGALEGGFNPLSGSTLNISGGSVGNAIRAGRSNSEINVFGDEFELNGVPFEGSTITLATDDILTATLLDGSVLVFSEEGGDNIADVSLIRGSVPAADLTPSVVGTVVPDSHLSLRSGQVVTITDGGVLGSTLAAVGATIDVEEGGTFGLDRSAAELVNTTVNVDGGTVDYWALLVYDGSELNLRDGVISPLEEGSIEFDLIRAQKNGVINISGGTVNTANLTAVSGTINVSGGDVRRISSGDGGVVNITGGIIEELALAAGSTFNVSGGNISRLATFGGGSIIFSGTEFFINGTPIDSLVIDEPFTITDRNFTLTGTLEDGSPLNLPIGGERLNPRFVSAANLSVILVEGAEEEVEEVVIEEPLSPAQAILDFEDISGFTVINGNSELSASDVASSGASSLEVEANGFTVVQSPELSTADLPAATNSVSVDLFVGSNQPNPFWIGAIQFYVHAPSANIFNAYVGQIELTGITQDEFTTLTFDLPSRIANALAGSHDDVQLRYALNVNRGSGPYFLDNIQFGE